MAIIMKATTILIMQVATFFNIINPTISTMRAKA